MRWLPNFVLLRGKVLMWMMNDPCSPIILFIQHYKPLSSFCRWQSANICRGLASWDLGNTRPWRTGNTAREGESWWTCSDDSHPEQQREWGVINRSRKCAVLRLINGALILQNQTLPCPGGLKSPAGSHTHTHAHTHTYTHIWGHKKQASILLIVPN